MTIEAEKQKLLAAQKDEVFSASIEFIKTLTGMEPPPIEVAPPEVFQPFKDFTEKVCAIFVDTHPQPKQEQGEPVALQMDVIVVNLVREGINKHRARELAEHFIKHTHPQPKREPLTDEQIRELFNEHSGYGRSNFLAFARAIEAAHGIKEKNT